MSENMSLPDKRQPDHPEEKEPDQEEDQSASDNQTRVDKVLRKLADSEPEKLMEFMAMNVSSVGNPLLSKMNAGHVDKIINLASKHDERTYDIHKITTHNENLQWIVAHVMAFAASLVFVGLVVFILWLFREKPDVLIPSLAGIGGFVSGFAGGWGFGSRRKK
ncbi:MAG: hypothetical protein FJ280_24115 [Planctomycetes bacterium]|nr:hypothetical protein [Planctomycetota bacterium]